MNIIEHIPANNMEELIKLTGLTGGLMEIVTASRYGLIHNTEYNGVDAFCPETGCHVECKNQNYSGNFLLRGRAKYGGASQAIFDKKYAANEWTIVNGTCNDGIMYYEFGFNFEAIADQFEKDLLRNSTKDYYNIDVLPKHYAHHSTFEVLYICPMDTLMANEHKFTQNFYKMLLEWSEDMR